MSPETLTAIAAIITSVGTIVLGVLEIKSRDHPSERVGDSESKRSLSAPSSLALS